MVLLKCKLCSRLNSQAYEYFSFNKPFCLKFEEKESNAILEEHTQYFCCEGLQR